PVPMVEATMGLFSGSTELEKLVLSKPVQTYIPFDESVLKGLQSLSKLQELRVHQTRIAGGSLAPFSLKHLDLNYDRTFNDQGMNSLKSMTALSKLYLRGTSITDAGLKNLSGLAGLTELDLADTGVSDAGLVYLAVPAALPARLYASVLPGSPIAQYCSRTLPTGNPSAPPKLLRRAGRARPASRNGYAPSAERYRCATGAWPRSR